MLIIIIIIIAKILSEVVFWQEQGEELKESNEGCIITIGKTLTKGCMCNVKPSFKCKTSSINGGFRGAGIFFVL